MEVLYRTRRQLRPFAIGLFVGGLVMYLGLVIVLAASTYLAPNGDGTIGGARVSCTGATANYQCINDATGTSSAPAGSSHVLFDDAEADYYQLATISGVDTVSIVRVPVYHRETNTNEAVYVSLWDSTETTQYGTEVQLTTRTTAQWDTANFTGLSLTQTQLDGLRVRILCQRPGGGARGDCEVYGLYPVINYTEVIDVVVSTTGTQQDLEVGASSAYVGGSFVVSENTSSRDITSVTITETGTVDAQNHLKNVQLWYENASDCTAEGFGTGGSETQYGSTDADGFTSANGTVTFTDTGIGITTASELCFYVVLDVHASSTYGQTLELQITDPTSDVVGAGGPVISPGTAVALSGTTILRQQDRTLTHFHWRSDDGDQGDSASGATSATNGSEDTTNDNVPRGVNQRLRVQISNEGNQTSDSSSYRLEYGTKVTTCSAVASWTDVGAVGGDWDMAGAGSGLSEGGDTTDISSTTRGALTNANTTFVGTAGQKETSSQTSALTLTTSEYYEIEYAIVANGSASDGATYCFRVTDAGTRLESYDVYPEATIAADLLVASFGSQTANVSIPSTSVYTGGGFSITDTSAGTHEISEVVISSNGTVDQQNDISNVVLWYENDTNTPFDCTGESFNGDETQFGATSTAGFNGSNQATFTDVSTITVGPSQGVCLYVTYWVDSEASDGETFEVRIADPSSDITIDAGSISPASLVDISGATTFVAPIVTQAHYHWRGNDDTESGTTTLTNGLEDTVLTEAARQTPFRVRFGIQNTGGGSAAASQYRLEWTQKISTCALASGWERVDTPNDEFEMVSSQLVDNSDTTDISLEQGGVSNNGLSFVGTNGGQKETSDITNSVAIPASSILELEYSIQASSSASQGATYCFRVTQNGTEILYSQYPEMTIKLATDFAVYRGVTTIPNGATTASITQGGDYDLQLNDATRAFVRITNTAQTGAGPASTGNHNAADVTAYVSNPSNITSGITFARAGTSGDTRVAWEVVEYVGAAGGENEFIVRSAGVATYAAANLAVSTGNVTVADNADVVPWITGQGNPDTGRFDYNTGLSTSAWNTVSPTSGNATFTRGEAGADAVNVSYALIEFTGANWIIQRASHTYAAAGALESQSITAVNSIARTFLHAQKRVGSGLDTHANFGHEVYLSGIGTVQFRIDGLATTPGGHVSVAWVIENTQTAGRTMKVWRSNSTIPSSGTAPVVTNPAIGTDLTDVSIASIFANSRSNGTGRTFPEPIISARLLVSSSTAYELWVGDPSDNVTYRTEVVEWPTANSVLTQNDFRLYEDDDNPTPASAWPAEIGTLAENQEMTGVDNPLSSGENIRIRMNVTVSAATLPPGVDAFALEYAARPSGSCGTIPDNEWYRLGDIGSTTAAWRGHDSGPLNDGDQLAATVMAASDVAGTYEEQNNTSLVPAAVLVGDDIEYEWNVEHNNAAQKTDYCFRMTYADGNLLDSYDAYPVVRTVGYGPQVWDWRWFDDATNTTPTLALSATNSAPIDIANDNIIKLRTVVSERSGAAGVDVKFKLQFSEYADFSAGVFDVASSTLCEGVASTTANIWCYADGAGVDNAVIDDNVLGSADACTAGSGNGCGTHNESISTSTATLDQPALSDMEFEFTLRNDGARANAVYYFRLYDVQNDEPVPASSTLPSLVVEGAQLVFTLEGVTAGTSVDGVTADVSTTPTSVPFGSVPLDTDYEAIYRLNVNTNATEGYQMFMYARQPLLNSYGTAIPDILATNGTPDGWSDACPVSLTGCFGYHTSDDVLSSGSTRFSPNDSYARISTTTPDEIMYSSSPTDDTVDIVYRLKVRQEQPAGDYQTEIVYLAVPVF